LLRVPLILSSPSGPLTTAGDQREGRPENRSLAIGAVCIMVAVIRLDRRRAIARSIESTLAVTLTSS